MHGFEPAGGVRVHVSGIDVVRDAAGTFRVLEDNVRVPSGVSYVLENRRAMAKGLPEAFGQQLIRPGGGVPPPAAVRAAQDGARPASTIPPWWS